MVETMQCVRIAEPGMVEIDEAPIPEIDPGEVLVEIEATGVGQAVVNYVDATVGAAEQTRGRIPANEAVGRVVDVGGGVTHVEAGDRVGAYFVLTCDFCEECLSGHQSVCPNQRGRVAVEIDGGLAEYIRLPAGNALPIPESIDPVNTTVVDVVAICYHVADQRMEIDPGDKVMVLGAGRVGLHQVQMAQFFGASVTAVDINEEALRKCDGFGAAHTIDTNRQSLTEAVDEIGLTYDSIVDYTGVTDLIEEAAAFLGPRGRLVNMTAFLDRAVSVSPRDQVYGEKEMVGSRSCSKDEFLRGGKLVADEVIAPVVTDVVDFDGVPDLLDGIRDGDVIGGAFVPG